MAEQFSTVSYQDDSRNLASSWFIVTAQSRATSAPKPASRAVVANSNVSPT